MTPEQLQDFVTRFAAAWAARDGKAFLDLWHPDGTLYTPLVNRPIKGSELPKLMELQIASAPDFVWQLLELDLARRCRDRRVADDAAHQRTSP